MEYATFLRSLWDTELKNNYPLSIPFYRGTNHTPSDFPDERIFGGMYHLKNNFRDELREYINDLADNYRNEKFYMELNSIEFKEFRDKANWYDTIVLDYDIFNIEGTVKLDHQHQSIVSFPAVGDNFLLRIKNNTYTIVDELVRNRSVNFTKKTDFSKVTIYFHDTFDTKYRLELESISPFDPFHMDVMRVTRLDINDIVTLKKWEDVEDSDLKLLEGSESLINPLQKISKYEVTSSNLRSVLEGIFDDMHNDRFDKDDIRFKYMYSAHAVLRDIVTDSLRYIFRKSLKAYNTKLITQSYHNICKKLYPLAEFVNENNMISYLSGVRKIKLNGIHGIKRPNESIRNYNRTYLGKIDPLETPESGELGLTLYRSISSYYDIDGNIKEVENHPVYQNMNFSGATIPFLQHNDSIRCNMATSHIKHSIPIESNEVPLVSTGMDRIIFDLYHNRFENRLNNYRILDIDGRHQFKDGYLTLGRNVRVAYMPYKGLNYEDSVVISESLSNKLVLMKGYKVEYDRYKKFIEDERIPKVGDYVKAGEFLARYNSGLEDTSNKLIRFGEKSKTITFPEEGIVSMVDYYIGDEIVDPTQLYTLDKVTLIRIEVSSPHPIEVGDKISFSSAGKGIVSIILPDDKMPRLPNGEPVEVIYNTLGIPSRMNLSQLLESATGEFNKLLSKEIETKVNSSKELKDIFIRINSELKSENLDEFINFINDDNYELIKKSLSNRMVIEVKQFDNTVNFKSLDRLFDKLDFRKDYDPSNGKRLFLPEIGKETRFPVFYGMQRILALEQLVSEKSSVISVNSLSDYKEKPQKMGEMEVLALEAHGSRHFINEVTRIRSNYSVVQKVIKDILGSDQINLDRYRKNNDSYREFLAILRGMGIVINYRKMEHKNDS